MSDLDARRLRTLRFVYVGLKGLAETVGATVPLGAMAITIAKTFYEMSNLTKEDRDTISRSPDVKTIIGMLNAINEQLAQSKAPETTTRDQPDPSYERLVVNLGLHSTITAITFDALEFCQRLSEAPLHLANCEFVNANAQVRRDLAKYDALAGYRVIAGSSMQTTGSSIVFRFPNARARFLRQKREFDRGEKIEIQGATRSALSVYFADNDLTGQLRISIRKSAEIKHDGLIAISVPSQKATIVSFETMKEPVECLQTTYLCTDETAKGTL